LKTEKPFSIYKPPGRGVSTCRLNCSPLPIVIDHQATTGSGP
jgi:hypothetical protein